MQMAKTKTTANKRARTAPSVQPGSASLDSIYFLKLVMFLVVGSQWVRLTDSAGVTIVPLPVGLIIGLLFAAHDHFQIDRKIEYAVLLIAMFIGFWTQVGIYIQI